MIDLHQTLQDCCLKSALKAGSYLTTFFCKQSIEAKEKYGPEDIVTQADLGAEAILIEQLTERARAIGFKTVGILSEEAGGSGLESSLTFVIDPLDGTRYFARYSVRYAISIAALLDGIPVAGVVHFPALNRTLYAGQQSGAFEEVSGRKRKLKSTARDSLIVNVRKYSQTPQRIALLKKKISTLASRPESYGPTTLSLANQASGLNDITLDIPSKRWDVAALIVILQEAGYSFFDLNCEKEEFTFDLLSEKEIWPLSLNPAQRHIIEGFWT